MTDAELQAIRDRCAKATPPPWKAHGKAGSHAGLTGLGGITTPAGWLHEDDGDIIDQQFMDDITFAANARQDVPALLTEVERLRAQLPEGMEHCTIVFKECKLGHGWLTATNWVQHDCPTCELHRQKRELAALRNLMTVQTEAAYHAGASSAEDLAASPDCEEGSCESSVACVPDKPGN